MVSYKSPWLHSIYMSLHRLVTPWRFCHYVRSPPPSLFPLRSRLFSTTRCTEGKAKFGSRDLLARIDHFVQFPSETETLTRFVHRTLDRHLSSLETSPVPILERVISHLLDRLFLREAVEVYGRLLQDGYMPSNITYAKMLALEIAKAPETSDIKSLIEPFAEPFSNLAFSQDDLLRVLKLLMDLEVAPDISLAISNLYFQIHDIENELPGPMQLLSRIIDFETSCGNVDNALDLLSAHASSVGSEPDRMSLLPYTAFVHAIKRTRDWDDNAICDMLDIMKGQELEPNVTIFNLLIAREVRRRSYRVAFSLYTFMSKSGTTPPDTFTFSSLFSALRQLYYRVGLGRSRRYRIPDSLIPPRQLYREMVPRVALGVMPGTSKPGAMTMTSSLCNVILRAFLASRDYPGAFVVIQSFSIFNVPLGIQTYRIVLQHILTRVYNEIKTIRNVDAFLWSDRFLGLRTPIKTWVLSKLDVTTRLATHILSSVNLPRFKLSTPLALFQNTGYNPAPRVATPKYITPTMEQLEDTAPLAEDVSLAVVPLLRILRQAILADFPEKTGSHSVSKAIATARREMIPRAKRS